MLKRVRADAVRRARAYKASTKYREPSGWIRSDGSHRAALAAATPEPTGLKKLVADLELQHAGKGVRRSELTLQAIA